MILAIIAAVIVLAADIITKIIISENVMFSEIIPLISGVLNITNIPNDGIAFGMLDDARWLFMTVTVLLVLMLMAFIVFAKGYHKLCYFSTGLVLGGGLGNLVDRIVAFGGYDKEKSVVDFIDFCAFPEIWMWTFNIADAAICVGCAILAIYVIFYDKKAFNNGYKGLLFEEKKQKGYDSKEKKENGGSDLHA